MTDSGFDPPDDVVTRPWWDATRDQRLQLQRCPRCGAVQHPPRSVCARCGDDRVERITSTGRGVVDAWTVVDRAPQPGFTPPYVVARVRLDEGPVLLTNLEGATVESWRIGAPVSLAWRALPDGRHLPVFVPREA